MKPGEDNKFWFRLGLVIAGGGAALLVVACKDLVEMFDSRPEMNSLRGVIDNRILVVSIILIGVGVGTCLVFKARPRS